MMKRNKISPQSGTKDVIVITTVTGNDKVSASTSDSNQSNDEGRGRKRFKEAVKKLIQKRQLVSDWDKWTDLRFISTIFREGLNIDLEADHQFGPDAGFYSRLRQLALLCGFGFMFCLVSWITWNNQDIDPIFTGNYFRGLKAPKEIIIPLMADCIFMCSIGLPVSWLVYTKDPHLSYLTILLKVIIGLPGAKLDRGMDERVIDDLQKVVMPWIAFLKFMVTFPRKQLTFLMVCGFLMPVTVFTYMSTSYLMTWKVAFLIVWGIMVSLWLQLVVWSLCGVALITVLPCNFFLMTLRQTEKDEEAERKARPITVSIEVVSEAMPRKLFYDQLIQMKYLVYFIRRYNPSLRLVIGWAIFFLSSATVVYVFCIFFTDTPAFFRGSIFVYAIGCICCIVVLLMRIARFSFNYRKRVEVLLKAIPLLDEDPRKKRKLLVIIDEMRNQNSFDCSVFITEINYLLSINILAEMFSYFLLVVETYVIN